MAGSLERAISWAYKKANGPATYNMNYPYAGYSSYQGSLDKVNPNGETYVCASFVWYALTAGGFNVGNAWAAVGGSNRWDTPGYLLYELKTHGWTYHSFNSSEIRRGDILVRIGHHTEIAVSNTKTIGAHNHYPNNPARDISEGNVSDNPWDGYFRTTETLKWVEKVGSTSSAQTLNQSEMENNAICFYTTAKSYGWSDVSIAAVLGNMEVESTINPGAQNLSEKNGDRPNDYGIGLIQWTGSRHTKMFNWVASNYKYWYNGIGQTEYLKKELSETRWTVGSGILSSMLPDEYRFSNGIDAMTCSSWTLEQATAWFFQCVEYVAIIKNQSTWNSHFTNRYESAQKWMQFCDDTPTVNVGTSDRLDKKKGMPLWMMTRKLPIIIT